MPAFISRLRQDQTIGARALEFCILTAARSGEVLGATWDEIDFDARVWAIPASRMKAARKHRIPLEGQALAILEHLEPLRTCAFVFPSPRGPRALSHVVMQKVLNRMGVDVTTHGFRSTFRDWAGNETHAAREIAEAALAHVIGNAAEQAYRRGDALEKRRALMEAWAAYCKSKKAGAMLNIKTADARA